MQTALYVVIMLGHVPKKHVHVLQTSPNHMFHIVLPWTSQLVHYTHYTLQKAVYSKGVPNDIRGETWFLSSDDIVLKPVTMSVSLGRTRGRHFPDKNATPQANA